MEELEELEGMEELEGLLCVQESWQLSCLLVQVGSGKIGCCSVQKVTGADECI